MTRTRVLMIPGCAFIFFCFWLSVNSLSSPVNGCSERRRPTANVGVHSVISTIEASSTSSELWYSVFLYLYELYSFSHARMIISGNRFFVIFERNLDAHRNFPPHNALLNPPPIHVYSAPQCLLGLNCYLDAIYLTMWVFLLFFWASAIYRDRLKITIAPQKTRQKLLVEVKWFGRTRRQGNDEIGMHYLATLHSNSTIKVARSLTTRKKEGMRPMRPSMRDGLNYEIRNWDSDRCEDRGKVSPDVQEAWEDNWVRKM